MTKSKWSYKEYYEKNKTEFNARRRARYKQDVKLQKAARLRAKMARRRNKPSDGTVVNLTEGTAYSLPYVAKEGEVKPYKLRYMESKGIIPPPTIERAQRFYTEEQKGLILALLSKEIDSETVHELW